MLLKFAMSEEKPKFSFSFSKQKKTLQPASTVSRSPPPEKRPTKDFVTEIQGNVIRYLMRVISRLIFVLSSVTEKNETLVIPMVRSRSRVITKYNNLIKPNSTDPLTLQALKEIKEGKCLLLTKFLSLSPQKHRIIPVKIHGVRLAG